MLQISFEPYSTEDTPHEFDMGHIVLSKNEIVLDSKNRTPDQSMMVFVAASELLDEVIDICENKPKKAKFIGCDSSFTLEMRSRKDGEIEIWHNQELAYNVTKSELLSAAYSAALTLNEDYKDTLDGSGAALEDLQMYLGKAQELIA